MASTQIPSLINLIQFFAVKDLFDLETCQFVKMVKLQNEITKLDLKCNQMKRGFRRGEVSCLVPVTATVVRGRERSPDSDTPVSLTS